MTKLLRRFKKLLLIDKVKFVIFFPLLIIAWVVDKLIDIGAFVCRFVLQQCREFLTIGAVLLISITVIFTIVYFDETIWTYKGRTEYDAKMYVWMNCHEMCNNFIVSKDGRIRGFVRADKENIDKILSVLDQYDIEDKDKIIECLNEFRNGNYHSAVWLHNYCWTKIDGEVGYAIGLKDKYK